MSTILIIDDDEAISNLEQEVLERAGYEVQSKRPVSGRTQIKKSGTLC